MKLCSLTSSKILLVFCNFLLTACGCTLITGGLLILCDSERILLSRLLIPGETNVNLPQPLLYYISIAITLLGVVVTCIGILGCWASCLQSYCLLITYFLVIITLLVGECVVYIVSWAWPHCLGLNFDAGEMTTALQSSYGVPGHDVFTAAVDLVQASFNCCGISTSNDYDTSLWRLQALGPKNLLVPLTCCTLGNRADLPGAYLNPEPINSTLCQALEPARNRGLRHSKGCIDELELWYRGQYIIFLAAGLIMVLVEFAVLLSSILAFARICAQRDRRRRTNSEDQSKMVPRTPNETQCVTFPKAAENIYQSHQTPVVGTGIITNLNGGTTLSSHYSSFGKKYKS